MKRERRAKALSVFGLGVFAVSVPLVRVLVDAPEFFLAHGTDRAGVVAFFLVAIIVIPLAGALVASLPGSAGRAMRTVVVAVLALIGAGGLLQPLAPSSAFGPVALAVAAAFVVTERRWSSVQTTAAVMSLMAIVLLAWTFGPSRVGSYVRSADAAVIETSTATVPDEPGASVFVIVFDEMSIVPLLDDELAIDASRFPNLAALAGTSHWFRSASSVSPQTSASVPALLSGTRADLTKVPVSSDYPTNLFLQLGGSYDVASYEPMTDLCSRTVCDVEARRTDGGAEADAHEADEEVGRGWTELALDASLVLRHAVSSDAMRADLPSISQGWAGFIDGPKVELASADDAEAAPQPTSWTLPGQVAHLGPLLEIPEDGERPSLRVAHLIAPHMPWITLPDGTTYDAGPPRGLIPVHGALAWSDDAGARRSGYQRYVMQLGALDRAVGELRATLSEQGRWDDALVVVTADHGTQFEPGDARSVSAGGIEITGVPFFLKEPGQTKGTIDDRAVLTIDLVPTVLGRLGLRSPSKFDGLDLFADEVPDERDGGFLVSGSSTIAPEQSTAALRAAVERRSTWIPGGAGWDRVFQPGIDVRLVGEEVASLDPAGASAGTWTRTRGEAGHRATGRLALTLGGAVAVVAACDGIVAGAAPAVVSADDIELFTSPERCADPDAASMWLLDDRASLHPLETTP